jgi:hypothetical protein
MKLIEDIVVPTWSVLQIKAISVQGYLPSTDKLSPMKNSSLFFRATVVALCVQMLSGCAVIAVADAAVTVVATGVKTTAKVAGAAVNAVLPD